MWHLAATANLQRKSQCLRKVYAELPVHALLLWRLFRSGSVTRLCLVPTRSRLGSALHGFFQSDGQFANHLVLLVLNPLNFLSQLMDFQFTFREPHMFIKESLFGTKALFRWGVID